MKTRNRITVAMMLACGLLELGCNRKPAPPAETANNGTVSKGHTHADGTTHDDHDDAAAPAGGHHGPVIELGTATIGPFMVRASRDAGQVQSGSDVPIDVWLTSAGGGKADLSQVVAVRFWIGVEGGDSVKAKADIENPAEPNHWHTHAEVPHPFPAGSNLWVEIEIEGQGKKYGSFDLKL